MIKGLIVNGGSIRRHRFHGASSRLFKSSSSTESGPNSSKTELGDIPFYHRFKVKDKAILVRRYAREQGFLLPKGNPKGIHDFDYLLRDDISFINRNRRSGTRILVDSIYRRSRPQEASNRKNSPVISVVIRLKLSLTLPSRPG